MLCRPFTDSLNLKSKLITVLVGDDESPFTIHEDVLCSSSDLFKAALSNEWLEKKDATVKLPEQNTEIFTIYGTWLYRGKLPTIRDDGNVHTDGVKWGKEWNRLVGCYELGDFLQDKNFKDATIDAFDERMVENNSYWSAMHSTVYAHSLSDSPHRNLMVDFLLATQEKSDFESMFQNHSKPRDFLADLAVAAFFAGAIIDETYSSDWFFKNKNMSDYHEHTKLNKPCYKARF